MWCGKQIKKELKHAPRMEKFVKEKPSLQKHRKECACFHQNIQIKSSTQVSI